MKRIALLLLTLRVSAAIVVARAQTLSASDVSPRLKARRTPAEPRHISRRFPISWIAGHRLDLMEAENVNVVSVFGKRAGDGASIIDMPTPT